MWRHAGVTMGAVLLLGAPVICAAQHRHKRMPPSEGASVAAPGFSSERLSRIDSAFARALDRREIEGAVILVLRDGQTAYERAFGWADREEGRQMRTNAIFRIASQTKAITSVAVMSLVEEGRIALTDPVSRFIPEFARTTVLQHASSGYAVVVAQRPITIHDLLTHTAGISYGTDSGLAQFYRAKGLGPAAGYGWYTGDKDEPICETMERLASLPFAAQPGARFVYGYNTDILGCVVERASGMSLADFIDQRITVPEDARHALLRAARRSRTIGHGVRDERRGQRGAGRGRPTRTRELRRRPAHELFRRGGSNVDGCRLCPVPRDDAQWRRARWRPHPLAGDRRAHDDKPDGYPLLAQRCRIWPRLLRHTPTRCGRACRVSGDLRLERRLRDHLRGRPTPAARDRVHDATAAEPEHDRRRAAHAGVSGAAGLQAVRPNGGVWGLGSGAKDLAVS